MITAVILKTDKIEETYQFYRSLDIPLEKVKQRGGSAHYACELAGVHFAIYELAPWKGPERRTKNTETMVGFQVKDLSLALEKVTELNCKIIIQPEDVPWGKRAVVTDPDGRAVELNQTPEKP